MDAVKDCQMALPVRSQLDTTVQLTQVISAPEKESRTRYSDDEILKVAQILHDQDQISWSTVPRLYIVLRKIGCLPMLDRCIDQSINDYWFPFEPHFVPQMLDAKQQDDFILAQTCIITSAVEMEKSLGTADRHHVFRGQDKIPFDDVESLGRGAMGEVHRFVSRTSGREFARKRFRRQKGPSASDARNFLNEVNIVRKLRHRHCVQLVGIDLQLGSICEAGADLIFRCLLIPIQGTLALLCLPSQTAISICIIRTPPRTHYFYPLYAPSLAV